MRDKRGGDASATTLNVDEQSCMHLNPKKHVLVTL